MDNTSRIIHTLPDPHPKETINPDSDIADVPGR